MIQNFDEIAYLDANVDVKEAVERGEFQDALHHLEVAGLKEIEQGLRKFHKDFELFNEALYLENFESARKELEKGKITSAFEHFCSVGYSQTVKIQNDTDISKKENKLIVIVGIPRSGLTLLTSIMDAHSKITSWFLPLSTRREKNPPPFKNMEDIKKQYAQVFPEHDVSDCKTWVISESTSDGSNTEWLTKTLQNMSTDETVDTEIIWQIRSLPHSYLSQCYAAKHYWGAKDLEIDLDGYKNYLHFAQQSYSNIHTLLYPYTFTLVSYEALVKEPEKVLTALMKRTGDQYEPSQKEYFKTFPSYKAAGDPGICEKPGKITFEKVEKRRSEWLSYTFLNSNIDAPALEFYKEFERTSNHVQFMHLLSKEQYRAWMLKNLFEPEYYLLNNNDVMMAKVDPFSHYLTYGWKEFRQPNSWFNGRSYLEHNGEVKTEPLSHYLMFGRFNSAVTTEPVLARYKNLVVIDPETYEINDDLMLTAPKFDTPEVSIVIPAYNQQNYTLACIESIIKHTDNVSYEIIVMDDKSPDIEAREIGKYMQNILFHSNEENLGFVRNCNFGATFAKGKYIFFLNNDTNVQPDWLSSLVELIESSDEIGMVGSRLVYPDGEQQEAGGIVWDDASGWNFGRLDDPYKPQFNYVKEADYLTGAAMMIRRSLWEEIGGFDERYVPAYYEDTDLAFEVRKHGYRTLYQPRSVVIHFEGISNGTDLGSGIKRYQVVNKENFYEKWKEVLTKDHFPNAQDVFLARDRSKNKKHMLFVDHYLPHYDQDAGSKATYQYLKIFAKNNIQVHFIGDNFYNYPGTPYLEALTQKGIEVLSGNWYAHHWKEWFAEHSKYFDYVVLSRPHISVKYIDTIKAHSNAKVIYYGHDLHFLREKREYEIKKDESYLESSKKWQEIEMDLIEKSDVSYFFSNVEKEEIRKIMPEASVDVVPLYIYDTFKTRIKKADERANIMFVGGFGHSPNIDAMLWFLQEVWPLILKEIPDLKFYIIGSKPTKEILALANQSVIVTGFIDDDTLNAYYDNCKVAVAPLRYGAGIKGKVIDALYNAMPLVTTTIGAEGIENAQDAMMVADDPIAFARKVISLYRDDDLADTYAKNGARYCEEYFSEKKAKQQMANVFKEFKETK